MSVYCTPYLSPYMHTACVSCTPFFLSGEQVRFALPHLQMKQFPVQEHLMTCSRHLWNYPHWDPQFQLLGKQILAVGTTFCARVTHCPDSSLIKHAGAVHPDLIYRWIPLAKSSSGTQGAGFVIQDDNQSLNFPKVIRIHAGFQTGYMQASRYSNVPYQHAK